MIRRDLSLIEVIISIMILTSASGIALFNISKARTNYITKKACEEAKSLFTKTKTLSYILNNEIDLTLDPNEKKMVMSVTGMSKSTLQQHFETAVYFPPLIRNFYFEEDLTHTNHLQILPSYNFANLNLKLVLELDDKVVSTSLFETESTLVHLPLPDEILALKSL